MTPRAAPDRWFFDVWSRFYDAPWVQRLTYRPVHDAVLRTLGASPARSILDVGCGTGLLTARLREAYPRCRVVGCDLSGGMLRRARAHDRRARWVQADALHLPFPDRCFEALVSTEAFHWFPDQRIALAEFFRVLAPGGRLLVALINPSFELVSRATRLVSRLAREPLHWPTRSRMRRWVEEAGFEVEQQRRVLRVPPGILLPPVLTVASRLHDSDSGVRARRLHARVAASRGAPQ